MSCSGDALRTVGRVVRLELGLLSGLSLPKLGPSPLQGGSDSLRSVSGAWGEK